MSAVNSKLICRLLVRRQNVVWCIIVLAAFACLTMLPAQADKDAIGISISRLDDLAFGDIIPIGGAPGAVTISPDNMRSSSGVVVVADSEHKCAAFDVVGSKNAHYTVSMPSSATLSDGFGHSMLLDNFTSNSDDNSSHNLKLDKPYPQSDMGRDTLYVGATLNVGQGQAAGRYSGTFSVIVFYD